MPGTGVGFAFAADAGAGLAVAAVPGAPADCGGLVALKLFQLTQPVVARATAAKTRRDALVFIVRSLMMFTGQQAAN